MKAKTLITGGRGFVGVNLAKALAQSRDIHVLDNLHRASSTGWQGEPGRLHQADILEPASLSPLFEGITEVVHLAAYGSVIESITDPMQNFAVNVEGMLNVLRAAVAAGVRRLVFASTGGALIGDAMPPVNEDSLPKPLSPYGASKLCGEAYCHAFARSYGLETMCLRFGNVYGPHSAHKKGAVTTFIKALMRNQPMVIYGDGSASRDYIHVDDLCTGIEAALNAPTPGGEVFHLASGRETTVLELARILRDVADRPAHPIEFRDARRGEVTRNSASYERAHEALGFSPTTSLEAGLASTYRWFDENRETVLAATTSDS
jgi:UDP-glucose 4-epimerase